jgi:hypothetical protein
MIGSRPMRRLRVAFGPIEVVEVGSHAPPVLPMRVVTRSG